MEDDQRRRTNQIYKEDDRTPIHRDEDDDEHLPLSLSLGPTSYPSQISSPITNPSLRLAPPSPNYTAEVSYHQYLMTSMLHQNHQQIHPPLPPVNNFFPQTGLGLLLPPPPSSNQIPVRQVESRRNRNKNEKIPLPYPWGTNIRGKIQSLEELESKGMVMITGDVQCKHCEKVYQVSYNLREKYSQVENVFVTRKRIMRERAPVIWTNPIPVRCELCGRDKAVKPVIAEKKSKINWLFLLLGQTLGYCTLEQLKNFCKHANSHRTGAKDRVLYLTYLALCNMLEPNRDLFKRETMKR